MAREPLMAISARIRGLLTKWEEHPVLLQMLGISEKVLGLPCQTPVMKVLTGCEILLHKAQEWELNASREVSTTTQIAPLMGLIERWRRLELGQWKGLLETKLTEMESAAGRWWFFIYRMLAAFELNGGADMDDAEEAAVAREAMRLPDDRPRYRKMYALLFGPLVLACIQCLRPALPGASEAELLRMLSPAPAGAAAQLRTLRRIEERGD